MALVGVDVGIVVAAAVALDGVVVAVGVLVVGVVLGVREAVWGRVSAGLVRADVPPAPGEPGGRPPGAVVRTVPPPGVRGGVAPGRRESRRLGGRVPEWWFALVMTLCMVSPLDRPG
ncbi:hypothetical protein SNL152K_6157 [Streptomyces sp. NL15-2K]|nr:hypothetical protein SNL152K_6157 [Streptomyces sp. NL15-2K]